MSLPVEQQVTITQTVIERFWTKVDKSGPCWLWTAGRNSDGYGYTTVSQRDIGAHRMAYHLLRGPIPDGHQLDHLCRVRHCVNPDHLEPVIRSVNLMRGLSPFAINKRRTHCKHGHEFTPENTIRSRRGYRQCRACKRLLDNRRWREKKRKEAAA